jgi:hypothetical protein
VLLLLFISLFVSLSLSPHPIQYPRASCTMLKAIQTLAIRRGVAVVPNHLRSQTTRTCWLHRSTSIAHTRLHAPSPTPTVSYRSASTTPNTTRNQLADGPTLQDFIRTSSNSAAPAASDVSSQAVGVGVGHDGDVDSEVTDTFYSSATHVADLQEAAASPRCVVVHAPFRYVLIVL